VTMGVTGEPAFARVVRWPKAIPQHEVGHRKRLGEIAERGERFPGLMLRGCSYFGVAINDCCEHAEQIAEQVGESSDGDPP